MQDTHYGHRDIITGAPVGDPSQWIEWDYLLVTAFQLIEDYTTAEGALIWELESDRVYVNAKKKIDKFRAAVDSRTKGTKSKSYVPTPGEYFVPDLDLRGGEWPTITEYFKIQAET